MPKSNPLLRRLFQSIAGYNIDERIKITVDNLAETFNYTNIKSILSGHKNSTEITDSQRMNAASRGKSNQRCAPRIRLPIRTRF